MAEGNSNGNSGPNEASSSSGGQNNTSQQDSDKTKQAEKANTVPFYKLFSFADSTDMVLMITGTIAAIGRIVPAHYDNSFWRFDRLLRTKPK